MSLAVAVRGLTVRLGERLVLQDVNMFVEEGWVAAIVGPNGAGKTTLLRVILGLIKPTQGRVEVFGTSPQRAVKRGLVGYLPQRSNPPPLPITSLEMVMLGAGVDKNRALWALSLLEAEDYAHEPLARLSGGQAQRVQIARIVAQGPRLALLDEPSTGIDRVGQEDFYRLLLRIRDETGMTSLMVTHDIGAISSYVDQVYCLNVRLFCHGEASKCLVGPRLRELYGKEIDIIYHPTPPDERS